MTLDEFRLQAFTRWAEMALSGGWLDSGHHCPARDTSDEPAPGCCPGEACNDRSRCRLLFWRWVDSGGPFGGDE
jgi:hypothetical protein